MQLDDNNHSVFLITFHLVIVIKYGREVLDDAVSERAKEIFENISPNYNITLMQWHYDEKHVDIKFKAQPNSELSKFINAFKSASSRMLKKEFPAVREQLYKDNFWAKSYCLLTTGDTPTDVIKNYIESQGEKQ